MRDEHFVRLRREGVWQLPGAHEGQAVQGAAGSALAELVPPILCGLADGCRRGKDRAAASPSLRGTVGMRSGELTESPPLCYLKQYLFSLPALPRRSMRARAGRRRMSAICEGQLRMASSASACNRRGKQIECEERDGVRRGRTGVAGRHWTKMRHQSSRALSAFSPSCLQLSLKTPAQGPVGVNKRSIQVAHWRITRRLLVPSFCHLSGLPPLFLPRLASAAPRPALCTPSRPASSIVPLPRPCAAKLTQAHGSLSASTASRLSSMAP